MKRSFRISEGTEPTPVSAVPALSQGKPPKPKTIADDPIASAEWDRLVDLLAATLCPADAGIMFAYCDAYARLSAAREILAKEGLVSSTELGAEKVSPAATIAAIANNQLRAAAADLGCTPHARDRIPVPEAKPVDRLAAFLAKRPGR